MHSCFLLLLIAVVELAASNDLGLRDIAFYPKDRTNQEQDNRITVDLPAIIKPTELFISTSRYLGTFYWWARMTQAHAEVFAAAHPGIAS